MSLISLLFGSLVGFALGLTGGGGGIFAVPLLVYGMALTGREAVGVSLAAVGGTALVGMTPRLFKGEVDWATGLLFAVAGMVGAPLGNELANHLPESVLLTLFGLLMMVVAWRMWVKGSSKPNADTSSPENSWCRRNIHGHLQLTVPCGILLATLGLATGILSGLFGVGGGFIIVPALVLLTGMKIHHAIGTSLMAIALISSSGLLSYILTGNPLPLMLVLEFLLGGIIGMGLGSLLSSRLDAHTLQKVFAIAIVAVGLFVISKSI